MLNFITQIPLNLCNLCIVGCTKISKFTARTLWGSSLEFCLCMLTIAVHDFPFSCMLKSHGDWPINIFMFSQGITRQLDISCAVCSSHGLFIPASLCMMLQIAGGLRITLVKKSIDRPGLTTAVACATLKNVGLATLYVLDRRCQLEENINGCIPLLWEFAYHFFQYADQLSCKQNDASHTQLSSSVVSSKSDLELPLSLSSSSLFQLMGSKGSSESSVLSAASRIRSGWGWERGAAADSGMFSMDAWWKTDLVNGWTGAAVPLEVFTFLLESWSPFLVNHLLGRRLCGPLTMSGLEEIVKDIVVAARNFLSRIMMGLVFILSRY